MTSLDEYNRYECEKLDANLVDAYWKLSLDEEDKTKLTLSGSWDDTSVDLTPAIKAGETNTHLHLSPEEAPTALQFDRERGEPDCITGDELSRIISMTKLNDVDQSKTPKDGDVYIYNGETGKFETFNLTEALNSIYDSINTINNTIKRPDGVPTDTRVAWGNINLYSDYTNSDNRNAGLYTHSINENRINDEYFA